MMKLFKVNGQFMKDWQALIHGLELEVRLIIQTYTGNTLIGTIQVTAVLQK